MSEPASANHGATTIGLVTIRCASTKKPRFFASFTKSGPKLRFGTKWPSITSTDTHLQPAAFRASS